MLMMQNVKTGLPQSCKLTMKFLVYLFCTFRIIVESCAFLIDCLES